MDTATTPKKSLLSNLTFQILIAVVLGALLGVFVFKNFDESARESFSKTIKLLATIFIRLVQMIIAPLVFTTLVVGIAKLGDIKSVGRIGGRALAWFFSASFISLLIGMFWVNVLKPGEKIQLPNLDTEKASEIVQKTEGFSAQNFVEHIIPKSVVEAMATNEILQIVIFSIFFGLAAASIGSHAKPVINALDKTSHIILKMVNYVMKFAPFGVFGAIASVLAMIDFWELIKTYLYFFGSFLVGIGTLWIVLLLVGYLFLKGHMTTLLKRIMSPLVIAFGTTSSEAVFPKLTEELERFGVKDKVVSFMLPLGYSFNLDGSMMYMTFASIFIAQAYGVPLDTGTQMTMLLVLMLTSKGIAGVPRASLVVVAATCGMFKIPEVGIALILPIDHFCDMFRSATNVLGNAIATSVVGKWEKDS
ncbi:dicarboxylate/amino acid:cation symporter [Flavobacterium sedimenticola]|uniref:Cation:dicarboxylase symporter family transporter n=1 Tax=Flavobacterium sedimenticola TaxID=3043286 RepID=A0ABT6XQ09_9FLAO|nr:cation:dicarboxylase symporter family transporter [Flavobacterium sedimenticola]MDI9257103.1 cation:dicarboxylase symporter family transporter [Flavobacterium sedimenticola]